MSLEKVAVLLIAGGFVLALVAVLVPFFVAAGRAFEVTGGACIWIMFVPICFGYGPLGYVVPAVSAIVLVAMVVVAYLLVRGLVKRKSSEAPRWGATEV